MPIFYFHIYNDIQVRDEEGRELADEDAARELALKECRTLAAESVFDGHLHLDDRIDVHDQQDRKLFSVSFADAVTVDGQSRPPE